MVAIIAGLATACLVGENLSQTTGTLKNRQISGWAVAIRIGVGHEACFDSATSASAEMPTAPQRAESKTAHAPQVAGPVARLALMISSKGQRG